MGHSASPAAYTLTRDPESEDVFTAVYGCGLWDEDGHFWYPRTDKFVGRFDPYPDNTRDWAILATRRYGETSLTGYMQDRRRKKP